jgi:Fur family ferric uptake transcriptional regulator
MGTKETQVLEEYITKNNLKITRQRRVVLNIFAKCEDHISAEELYKIVTATDPKIGLATIYRTLALLTRSGLASELDFGDGQKRYEHKFMHSHHDHMICTECGKIIEFTHPIIEKLQDDIAKKNGFTITSHKLDLYGTCKECK